MLTYSTYVGGAGEDRPKGMNALDDGTMVIIGSTRSLNMPVTKAVQSLHADDGMVENGNPADRDGFIAAIEPGGNRFRFISYYGSIGDDYFLASTVDGQGNVIAIGSRAVNTDAILPLTSDAAVKTRGVRRSYITKWNAQTGGLIYASWLGPNSAGSIGSICMAGNGVALSGYWSSAWPAALPDIGGTGKTYMGGNYDYMVCVLENDLKTVRWSRCFGTVEQDSVGSNLSFDGRHIYGLAFHAVAFGDRTPAVNQTANWGADGASGGYIFKVDAADGNVKLYTQNAMYNGDVTVNSDGVIAATGTWGLGSGVSVPPYLKSKASIMETPPWITDVSPAGCGNLTVLRPDPADPDRYTLVTSTLVYFDGYTSVQGTVWGPDGALWLCGSVSGGGLPLRDAFFGMTTIGYVLKLSPTTFRGDQALMSSGVPITYPELMHVTANTLFIAGATTSHETYTLNAPQSTFGGVEDGYACRVDLTRTPTASVSINAIVSNVYESGAKGRVRLTRTGSTSDPLTVKLMYDHLTNGAYENLSDMITTAIIPAGSSTVDVEVTALDDWYVEVDWPVKVQIAGTDAYAVGSPSEASLTVISDDVAASNGLPTVRLIGIQDQVIEEPVAGTVEGPSVVFNTDYDLRDSAIPTNHYVTMEVVSARTTAIHTLTLAINNLPSNGDSYGPTGFTPGSDFRVIVRGDNRLEGDETLVLRMVEKTPKTYNIDPNNNEIRVIIRDRQTQILLPTVSITTPVNDTVEGSSSPAKVTFTRTLATTQALTVQIAATAGTATPGVDFQALPSTVTIPAGSASVDLLISGLSDTLSEGSETVEIRLVENPTVYNAAVPNKGVISISDPPRQPGPEIALRRSIVAVAHGGQDVIAGTQVGLASNLSYIIDNLGDAALAVGSVTLSGQSGCTATVTVLPPSSVAVQGYGQFTIQVTPSATTWSVRVSLANNDGDESPYAWTIASGATAPDISVSRTGTPVADGGSISDSGTGVRTIPLSISNQGALDLLLTEDVTITAMTGCTAQILTQPVKTIVTGVTTQLIIAATPTSASWSLTVSIASNDPDENPYEVTINGTTGTRNPGDTNDDKVVNIVDLINVKSRFGETTGSPRYDSGTDLNADGVISIIDLIEVKRYFGTMY